MGVLDLNDRFAGDLLDDSPWPVEAVSLTVYANLLRNQVITRRHEDHPLWIGINRRLDGWIGCRRKFRRLDSRQRNEHQGGREMLTVNCVDPFMGILYRPQVLMWWLSDRVESNDHCSVYRWYCIRQWSIAGGRYPSSPQVHARLLLWISRAAICTSALLAGGKERAERGAELIIPISIGR